MGNSTRESGSTRVGIITRRRRLKPHHIALTPLVPEPAVTLPAQTEGDTNPRGP